MKTKSFEKKKYPISWHQNCITNAEKYLTVRIDNVGKELEAIKYMKDRLRKYKFLVADAQSKNIKELPPFKG